MTQPYTGTDWYCEVLFASQLPVRQVEETPTVLAFHHTRPAYPVHVVVVPKRHIPSLTALTDADNPLLTELLGVVRRVAAQVEEETGACRVITNLGHIRIRSISISTS